MTKMYSWASEAQQVHNLAQKIDADSKLVELQGCVEIGYVRGRQGYKLRKGGTVHAWKEFKSFKSAPCSHTASTTEVETCLRHALLEVDCSEQSQ